MKSMEELIVSNLDDILELRYLRFVLDKVDNSIGPASDDVLQIIKEEWVAEGGKVPEGY